MAKTLIPDLSRFVRELQESGMKKELAEKQAEFFSRFFEQWLSTEDGHSQAASKKDLKIAELSLQKEIEQVKLSLQKEIEQVKLSLQKEIEQVRREIKAVELTLQKEIESVRKEIYQAQNKVIFWVAGFFIAQTALLFTLIKLLTEV